jgi:hypothetical protein
MAVCRYGCGSLSADSYAPNSFSPEGRYRGQRPGPGPVSADQAAAKQGQRRGDDDDSGHERSRQGLRRGLVDGAAVSILTCRERDRILVVAAVQALGQAAPTRMIGIDETRAGSP